MLCLHPRTDEVFDPSHRFETSWLLTPWALFAARALFSLYAFVVLFFNLIWQSTQTAYGGTSAAELTFSYFTVLGYWGLAFYFLFAAIHTFSYARTGQPLLNRWPRVLQTLHSVFYSTISTFPILVTIVFWGILYKAPWWPQRYYGWSNISQHALNSAFCLFELLLTRTNPQPWLHLAALIFILALYLGLAYLTHATEHVYVYKFLDPSQGSGKTAAYIIGVLVAAVVIFVLTKGLIWSRRWVTEKKLGKTGKFHGGRAMHQGDAELGAQRIWEK